jgi:hypothetical protein
MAFTIPEGLHPDLNPLAWLVGTWRGKGFGEYPNMDRFEFAHEIVFSHDERPFLTYFSRTWIIDAKGDIIRPGSSETGFWRVREGNILEVTIAHSSGLAEGWLGRFDGPKIQLVMDHSYASPSAKPIQEGSRLYGLVEGELFFAYDIATDGYPLQAHLWSTLPRSYD